MTRVNIHIEDREGGRYFVQVESSFPNQRKGEAFPVGIDAALSKVREFCRDFGVDDAAALPMMRPALQADIDRAQEAQQAAEDVEIAPRPGAIQWHDDGVAQIMAGGTAVFGNMTIAPMEL